MVHSPVLLMLLTALVGWRTPAAAGQAAGADTDSGRTLTRAQVLERLAHATEQTPADFSGANLSGLDLSGVDFKRANLTGARLVGTNCTHAAMFAVTLNKAIAHDADFSHAVLDVAVMRGADFERAKFRDASLYATIFIGADLTDADLSGARVIGTFENAKLVRARFVGTNFGADPGNQPMGVMFTNLTDADLTGADLTDANLRKASLVRANLTGANVTGADVTGANLAAAILTSIRGRDKVKGLDKAKNYQP